MTDEAMQSAENYNARAPDRGLKMKSRLEFLAEQAEEGGTAVYASPPIIVYTGSQRPRFRRRRPTNAESAVFGSTDDLNASSSRDATEAT